MDFGIQARPRSGRSGLFRCPCPRLDSDLKLSENQRDLPTTWLVNIKGLASSGYTSEYQAHYITAYRDCGEKWKRILSLLSIYHNGLKTFQKYSFTLFTPLNFKRVSILKIVSRSKVVKFRIFMQVHTYYLVIEILSSAVFFSRFFLVLEFLYTFCF